MRRGGLVRHRRHDGGSSLRRGCDAAVLSCDVRETNRSLAADLTRSQAGGKPWLSLHCAPIIDEKSSRRRRPDGEARDLLKVKEGEA